MENNRIGKTRVLFKEIRAIKGILHVKMGTIKDRNCMDLTEAKEIKKRCQEYTEELHKKDLHGPDSSNFLEENSSLSYSIVFRISLH